MESVNLYQCQQQLHIRALRDLSHSVSSYPHSAMPRHNMDSPRSQWEQGTPPWITRVAGGQSPVSSGAESDAESSSTESEKSCIKKLEVGSARVLPSPSMLQRRITEIDQQKEELKIELQLEIALLQGELQTETSQLHRHTQTLQALQQESKRRDRHRHKDKHKERESLEQERSRVEELRSSCEAKERLIPTQPESQREQLTVQLQQEKEAMEAAARAFEDWEFSVLEQESGIGEEDEGATDKESEGETESGRETGREAEISSQQHVVNTAQERVQQLERQLKEMEREKERELNTLRKERRELLHTTQMARKEKKLLADWSNVTGSAPCVMSLSPLSVHRPPQEPCKELSSLPRRRSSYRSGKLADRPLSAQGLVRTGSHIQSPQAYTSPPISHRLSNGHSNGLRPDSNELRPDSNELRPDSNSFRPNSNGFRPVSNGFRPDSSSLSPGLSNGLPPGHNGLRLVHGGGGGVLTPCNSTNSSRAASPCMGVMDLVEMERRLREAKAERERLLREREERKLLSMEERRQRESNSPRTEAAEPETPRKPEPEPPKPPRVTSSPTSLTGEKLLCSDLHVSLQQRSLPLFLTLNFDLRTHVESLGHGVVGCMDLRMTPRRCAGFLTKRGGRVKTWKKRWFLFDMDHRRLAYYTVSAAQSDVLCEDVRAPFLPGGAQRGNHEDLDGRHRHGNRRAQPILNSHK
ncbi:pleckstrin homology-like domain family B member 2 isoform X2 [Genypterus blacodes]|uniref:pleckstrin homology-like domain family B member 2 isoform X2 n=1 Tax=Genypterus blacodes TaxID=154954 RepID=UPI003F7724DB